MSILVVGSVALDSIETPFARAEETLGGAASYFTTAASLYSQVNLIAIVGSDFPPEHLDFWRKRPVNLAGLQICEGATFRWGTRYHMDMNARDTLYTHLGVYADFHPIIPDEYRNSDLLFLANIQPELQMEVLEQAHTARLTVLDTMELWIMTARAQLTEVIKRVDILVMSEEEIRQYTERASLVSGVRHLFDLGLKYVVVKQGSYGALLFSVDGTFFSAPTYPLEEVIDPTGAGDAFAGGFLGYLSTVECGTNEQYSFEDIRRGVVHGNIIGSFVCEDFSIGRLRTLTMDDVANRYRALVECSHFDPNWHFGG
ncbi:MAG TPA: PfkB family carbohydrate kinase [Ktedonobacteraceae bacterium]|nr:PfkB family carbohydrate kinase [Ktedonobacteraceae bacterium]